MPGLFVTATGTGIGKTLVTAALTHQLVRRGVAVRPLKPLISGYDPADPHSDTAVLLEAAGRPADRETVAAVSPWRFAAPLSPDMAAAAEGRAIDFRALVDFCRDALRGPETVLIEGVGGAFVPLDAEHLVADWMAALGLPHVLVAGSYLGTLSHTLATVEALSARGVAPAAVVVSESPDQPVPLAKTVEALATRLGLPVAPLPRIAGERPWERAPDLLGLLGRIVA